MEKKETIKIMREILDYLRMTPAELSRVLGYSTPQTIYDVLSDSPRKKNVGISKNLANMLCDHFPDLNKAYILTGEGDLVNNNSAIANAYNSSNAITNTGAISGSISISEKEDIKLISEKLKWAESMIEEKNKELEMLRKSLESAQKTIEQLLNKI